MNKLFLIIGVLLFSIGLLWLGQGLGYINWPASSFMISERKWAYYGSFLMVVGLLVIWWKLF